MVLELAVPDELNHARYADVRAAREARLIVARGDLPARPPQAPQAPRPPWRSPADPCHAR